MDDQVCPRCKTTKYRNPSLKLMVNVCGHTLCESCVDLLFLKGAGSCPECNVPLRRSNFRVQMFEDAMVEKEVDIRKRILRDYNKKEEDFLKLEDYNEYLEEIESIVYNLCHNIDIIGTNKRIEQYKKENRDIILRNKARQGREEYELEMEIQKEKIIEEQRRKEDELQEQHSKVKKLKEKEALIDELTNSHENASSILTIYAEHAQKQKEEEAKVIVPKNEFSTGVKFGNSFLPIPKCEDGPVYKYYSPKVVLNGPWVPRVSEVESKGFIKHIRPEIPAEKAGGYKSTLACKRALQEAMQGLFLSGVN